MDAQPVGLNAVFISATGVVLTWVLPTIAQSAGVNSFLLSYSLQESEGNMTRTRRQSGEVMTLTIPYQQGRTPGTAVSGLDPDSLYEFRILVNYSNPVLQSAEAALTARTLDASELHVHHTLTPKYCSSGIMQIFTHFHRSPTSTTNASQYPANSH